MICTGAKPDFGSVRGTERLGKGVKIYTANEYLWNRRMAPQREIASSVHIERLLSMRKTAAHRLKLQSA